jgi:integrase
VACVGEAVQSDCSASAATLILADGVEALPLGPSKAYARAVNRALGKLERKRSAATGRLREAKLPGRQADAASDVAAAYRRAESSLRKAEPTALEREAHPRLVAAIDRSGAAWAALASAARSENERRYDAARSQVRARDGELRNRVKALAQLGYDVE